MKAIFNHIRFVQDFGTTGSGGFGELALGHNRVTGKLVAIKRLRSELFDDPFIRESFKEEANKLVELDEHPNIVKLEDFILDQDRNTAYLIMEYLFGNDLKKEIRSNPNPMPVKQAALLIYNALNPLAFAHKCGVIHNDIKPANIFLTDKLQIKLIDFGISVKTGQGEEKKRFFFSLSYASPEQLVGKESFTSDIYSMGITLYEMITKRNPFRMPEEKITEEEMKGRIRNNNVPEIHSEKSYDSVFIEQLNYIIQKATNKQPSERYQTCEAFQNDLYNLIKS